LFAVNIRVEAAAFMRPLSNITQYLCRNFSESLRKRLMNKGFAVHKAEQGQTCCCWSYFTEV